MKTSLHLLYFEGCPNVKEARDNLRQALAKLGLPPRWTEVDLQSSEECPPRWRGFPSPTILCDGADIQSGATSASGAGSCRFAGAPTAAQIAAALQDRPRLAGLAALPAAAAGLLPATFCPACYPALAGLLGALGLGAYAERLLAPLTIGLLIAAVAGLAFQARRSRDFRPLAVGALGAAALYGGQFLLVSSTIKFAGVALLVVASFWNVLRRRQYSDVHCSACAEGR